MGVLDSLFKGIAGRVGNALKTEAQKIIRPAVNKAEEKLLSIQKEKEESDKRLLTSEIVLGLIGSLFLFSLVFIAAFTEMETWIRVLLIVFGFAVFLAAMFFGLRIEQKAGYYVCKKCNHKHIPSYEQVLWAPHVNRTRYMKCPNCGKKSWQKKVIK